jgi:hypothetical protein
MRIEEIEKQTMNVEVLKNFKCDICKKLILKKNDEESLGASLIAFWFKTESGGETRTQETSDFCKKCYGDIVQYLKTEKKAKIPSYYFNADALSSFDEEEQTNGKH